jgi:uncharacterized protein
MQPTAIECQNALVTKIALFLNYLSKENYRRLAKDMMNVSISSEGEILKLMLAKKYVSSEEVAGLKKACLSFARAQEDTRFGALCIQFEFLTQGNMNLALEEQKRLLASGNNMFLGDLLVEAGMLSERQRKLILQKQKLDNDVRKTGNSQPALGKGQDNITEIREKMITLRVTHESLAATMVMTDQFRNDLILSDLKQLIEKNGIIYGVANDDQLKNFLIADVYRKKEFALATGLAPEDGTDAQINYLFKRQYLKAGTIAGDGSIDFKNRGEIPFVAANDLLAEKIPPEIGRNGVNIFGDVVSHIPPLDRNLKCGKGVRLSEDKCQALAKISGYPKLTLEGELIVNDAYILEGDVDYTTGHLKFDKNIYITGTIKNGFKVEGLDVVAKSVDGGIIKARGDVCIENGITDASITTRGNMSAGFIHRSKIACMGDMDVRKEVVETDIVLEGRFEMLRGKMYASILSAKGGAKIWYVGSEKSKASVITVGISSYLEQELKLLNQRIERHQTRFESKLSEKEKMVAGHNALSRKIALLEQSRQKPVSGSEGMRENSGTSLEEDTKVEDRINQEIGNLYTKKNLFEKKTKRLEQEAAFFSNAVKREVAEKFNLKKRNQANPPRPILDVSGKIIPGTHIRGRYAKTIIQKNISRVRIMEMSCTKGQGAKDWEMIATRL